jgi:osmotically-inducible protein OsmY
MSRPTRRTHTERRSGPGLAACLVAAGLGAALMYLFDPAYGRTRRARLAQQGSRLARHARDTQDRLARETVNQVRGAVASVRSMVETGELVDDAILVERVRAALGHVVANPHHIDVKASGGRVTLKGPVTAEELGEIVACAERVRGVREVDNRLSLNTGIGNA